MKKIFCLETEWDLSAKRMRDKMSVQPLLNFLDHSKGVEFVFRNVASREDLKYYLKQLSYKTYTDYQIVYLAFHGSSKAIKVPSEPNNPLSFTELVDISKGAFQDKIIHFGSCRTFNTSDRVIQEFKEQVGAELVSGYTKTIDFIRSAIMDIAYFSELVRITNTGVIEKRIDTLYGNLKKELGFKIY